jgi:hypothetical protein
VTTGKRVPRSAPAATMSPLEEAALAYVAARERLEGADAGSVLERVVEVDMAWHVLHLAAGITWPACCDEESDEIPRPST